MGYLPIFLEVAGRRCVVVGGGEVAERKVLTLLEARADVTVISPAATEMLMLCASEGRIRYVQREYQAGDIEGAALLYAASDDAEMHRRLFAQARERGIPINVVDQPELCTFITPAVVTRGALNIAVSTGGASPATAKRIAGRIEGLFGPEYGIALEVLRAARQHLKSVEPDIKVRARKLTALAGSRIPEYLRKGNIDAVERVVQRHIGTGLRDLGLSEVVHPSLTDPPTVR